MCIRYTSILLPTQWRIKYLLGQDVSTDVRVWEPQTWGSWNKWTIMICQHVNKDVKYEMGFLGIKIPTLQCPQQTVICNSPNYPCLLMVYSRSVSEGTRAKRRQKWTDLHMVTHNITIWYTLQYSSTHPREPGLGKWGKARKGPDHLFLLWVAVWGIGEAKTLHFGPGRVVVTDKPASDPPETAASEAASLNDNAFYYFIPLPYHCKSMSWAG